MPDSVFETPRLFARHLSVADIDAMLAVYGDPIVVRHVGDGRPLGRQDCKAWVEVTQRNYATRGYGMYALVAKEGGTVVGFCGLVHPSGQHEPEIKYAFRRDCWGRGFATEATRGLLAFARRRGLADVIATVDPANHASHRVLAKAGLRCGGPRLEADGSQTLVFRAAAVTQTNG